MYVLVIMISSLVPSTGQHVEVKREYRVATLAECHQNGQALKATFAAKGLTSGYLCKDAGK